MLFFATLFDINYLSRARAMVDSLYTHCKEFRIFVLCLDNEVFEFFKEQKYTAVTPFKLVDLEDKFPKLKKAKENRSNVEYIFTLSPFLPLYVLETYSEVGVITSIDSDLYFYSDPSILFEKEDFSIQITPHRFPDILIESEKYGKYNVSFQTFKRDDSGLDCLRKWSANCLEWCHYRLENDKFADQKYLDDWPSSFKNVKIIEHPGAGLAPWNIHKSNIEKEGESVFVNGRKLVYFHFHGVRIVNEKLAYLGFEQYLARPQNILLQHVYRPYLEKLVFDLGTFTDNNIQRRGTKYSFLNLLFKESLFIWSRNWIFRAPNLGFIKTIYRNLIN